MVEEARVTERMRWDYMIDEREQEEEMRGRGEEMVEEARVTERMRWGFHD